MRTGGRNLLASSKLPSLSTFHSIVRALLTSLEHHPEVCLTICPPTSSLRVQYEGFFWSTTHFLWGWPEFCRFGANLYASYGICSYRVCTRGLYNVHPMLSFRRLSRNSLANCCFLQDEVGVISTFTALGQIHPTYTECITEDLLPEVGFPYHSYSSFSFCWKMVRRESSPKWSLSIYLATR